MRIIPVAAVDVPCNGCTSCCRGDLVFVHEEHGDILADYETLPMTHPLTLEPGHALRHKDGACIYLGETGCTIHPRRPSMCRQFDCRRFYLGFKDRAERRRAVKDGWASQDVIDAGKQRLPTLKKEKPDA